MARPLPRPPVPTPAPPIDPAPPTSLATPPRLGPRPLALHLLIQGITCAGWPLALTDWKDASPCWKPPLADSSPRPEPPPRPPPRPTPTLTPTNPPPAVAPPPEPRPDPRPSGTPDPDVSNPAPPAQGAPNSDPPASGACARTAAGGKTTDNPPPDPTALATATDREARRRLDAFLSGVEAYHAARPSPVPQPAPRVLWARGTTRLLLFDAAGDPRVGDPRVGNPRVAGPPQTPPPPVLLVPSLINRARILDLTPDRSLCRFLARRGHPVGLLDWQEPGADEAGFAIGAYVTQRLEPALAALRAATGQAPVIAGYCMGGLLALAGAARAAEGTLAGLVLMATPWDFAAASGPLAALARAQIPLCARLAALGQPIPADLVQIPFGLAEAATVARKYSAFARLDPRSARARGFVAVEDWLNDGVPLAAPAALEALAQWYDANQPARGAWAVDGVAIRPESVRLPSLLLIPDHDRIVPPASALALAERLPGARLRRLPLGHVAMIAGPQAAVRVFGPMQRWLAALPSVPQPGAGRPGPTNPASSDPMQT